MSHRHVSAETRRRWKEAQLRRTQSPHLAHVVERNIETLCDIRRQMEQEKGAQERLADLITAWSGSMTFVWFHVAWFGAWILINAGFTPIRAFDPYPFGLLTMIVSLEAIFLATFVLISQNRMQEVSDKRSDLDLQINLLAEYEITRILTIVDAIADHLGLDEGKDPEVDELKANVSPDELLNELEKKNGKVRAGGGRNG